MASEYGIQFKRTHVPHAQPTISQIVEGEIAINLVDKKLFTRHNNEIINIGFDYDTYVGNNFLARSGGPLSGLLSFDAAKLPDINSDIKDGSDFNLVHKGYVTSEVLAVHNAINTRVPRGTITVWYNTDPLFVPEGWSLCDGTAFPDDLATFKPSINPVPDNRSGGSYPYIIRL